MNRQELWTLLNERAHPSERPLPEQWQDYYWRLYGVVQELPAGRICEIGVRAGYSAFTMFLAHPHASILGIEADLDETREKTHGGRKGYYRHALEILAPFDFRLVVVNSHAIRRLPWSDLIYVDGDHSHAGCLQDLQLASLSTDTILVDDYDNIASVRSACDEFLSQQPGFLSRPISDCSTRFLLLNRTG